MTARRSTEKYLGNVFVANARSESATYWKLKNFSLRWIKNVPNRMFIPNIIFNFCLPYDDGITTLNTNKFDIDKPLQHFNHFPLKLTHPVQACVSHRAFLCWGHVKLIAPFLGILILVATPPAPSVRSLSRSKSSSRFIETAKAQLSHRIESQVLLCQINYHPSL